MLRPKAFRGDLWRWMALWYYGGVYSDAKYGFQIPVDQWLDFENDEFIICPCRLHTMNNPFIVLTQYHPLALLVIQEII
jgi:mannosyltransferase OCH1-like enzyme